MVDKKFHSLNKSLGITQYRPPKPASFMEKDATSENYLRDVALDLPLHRIRKVVDSTYFDENLQTAALLSEIAPEDSQLKSDLREIYGGKYLLEVWNNGDLLYHQPLKNNAYRTGGSATLAAGSLYLEYLGYLI